MLEAVLSERGQSLVALAVSMGARNLVGGYLEAQHLLAASSSRAPRPDATDRVLAFLARPEGQQLVGLATSVFISHGMRVYMDESLEVNLYEDIFSSMAKPQHLEAVKACIGTFAREAVGAAVGGGRSQVVQQQERQAHVRPAVTPRWVAWEAMPARGRNASACAFYSCFLSFVVHACCWSLLRAVSAVHLLWWANLCCCHRRLPGRLPTTIQELPRAELMGEQSADAQVPTEHQQQAEQQEPQQGGAHSPTSSSGGCEPPGECTPSQHDDLDSDSLLHASSRQPREQAKGSPQPAGSPEGLTVGTPLACESPSRKPPHPAAATRSEQQLPSRTQQRAAGSSSGHAQWVSAVGSEWLKTVRDPNGRSVMVELAGAAAKETVHGLSSALAERFDASWFVLAAFAALLCSWLCLQLLQLFMR